MDWTQLVAFAVLTLPWLAALIYFARTTWYAQRQHAELQRLILTWQLAQKPETAPIAARIAPEAEPAYAPPSPQRFAQNGELAGLDLHPLAEIPRADGQYDEDVSPA